MFDVGWGDWDEKMMVWLARGSSSAAVLADALRGGFGLISINNHKVVGLLDVQAVQQPPDDILPTLLTLTNSIPSNLVLLVLISASPVWAQIAQALVHIFRPYGVLVRVTSSPQEAYRLAYEYLRAWES